MIKYEDWCVGCSSVLDRPCLGDSCPNRNVPILYCDECGDEALELFEFDGQELCIDCIKKRLTKVSA